VDFALRNDNHLGTFLRSQKTDLDFWKLLTHFEQLKTHLQLMGRRFERRHIQSNVTGIAKAMENITHTTLAQELTPKQSQELFALWAPTLEANPQAVPWILKERLDQYRAADLNRESYYRFLGEFVLLKEFFPDAFPDEGKPLLSVVDRTVLTLQVILSHIYSDQSYSAQLGAPTNPLVASSNQVFDLFSDEFAAFQRNGSIIVSNTANRPPLFSRPGMYLCSRDCVIQAATAGNLESSSDSLERKFGRLDMHPLSLLMTGVVPETKIQVIYKNRDRNEIDSDYKIPIYRNASITLNFAEMGDVFILASGHTSAFWTEATPGAKGSDALLGDRQQAFGFVQATLSGAYLNQEPHGYLFDYQPLKGGCRQIGDTQQEVNCGAYPGESGADGKHGVRGGDLFIARYPQFLPHSYFVMIAAGSDGGDGGRGGNGGRQVHFIPENHDNNGMPHWSHPGAGGPGGRGGFNGRAGSIVLSGSFSHIEESRLDWTHPLIRFRGEVGKPGPTGKSNDGFAVEAPGKFNDPIETKKIYPPVPSPNAELADYTSVEGYTATVTNDKILQFSFEAK
jgi:hypothetical protein